MTKKSHARLQRDAEAKKNGEGKISMQQRVGKNAKINPLNNCWDDLNTIYESCAQLIFQHVHLASYLRNQPLMCEVVNRDQLVANIQLLSNDLGKLRDELTEINNQHNTKSGGSQDPDEVMFTITIYEQYQLFMQRHDAVVMPTVYHIVEQLDQAEKKLLEKTKQLEEIKNTPVPEAAFLEKTDGSGAIINANIKADVITEKQPEIINEG